MTSDCDLLDGEDWDVYRDRNGLTHLPGPNQGTPHTKCGLDVGLMKNVWHSPYLSALWCTECFQEAMDSVPAKVES